MPEPAREIGVVYDVVTKEVHGIIIPDFQYQLDDPAHVQPGEAMLRFPKPKAIDPATLHTRIAEIVRAVSETLK